MSEYDWCAIVNFQPRIPDCPELRELIRQLGEVVNAAGLPVGTVVTIKVDQRGREYAQ